MPVLVTLLAAAALAAAPAAPARTPMPPALADLRPYEGAWRAEQRIEGGPAGAVELTYEWVLDGRFMATHAVSRAGGVAIESRGFLGLDPENGALTSWTFLDDGSTSVTRCTSKPGADTLVFEGRAGAGRGEVRVGFVFEGRDAYRMLFAAGAEAGWNPAASMVFRRVKR